MRPGNTALAESEAKTSRVVNDKRAVRSPVSWVSVADATLTPVKAFPLPVSPRATPGHHS